LLRTIDSIVIPDIVKIGFPYISTGCGGGGGGTTAQFDDN